MSGVNINEISKNDKNEIVQIMLNSLVWVDQFMGHGHFELKGETEDLLKLAEMVEKYCKPDIPEVDKNKFKIVKEDE